MLKVAYFISSFLILTGLFLTRPEKITRMPSSDADVSHFVHQEKIRLSAFKTGQFFLLANTQSYSQVEIENFTEAATLELKLSCDQPYQPAISFSSNIKNRVFPKPDTNNTYYHLEHQKKLIVLIGPHIQRCQIAYKNLQDSNQWGLYNLRAETIDFPWLKNLIEYQDICHEKSIQFPQLTCLHHSEKMETLESSESGFIAKAEMLLGYKLDSTFIKNQDPYAEIDFSKAPKLKAIYVATLVYRSDFYGNVIARLLKFHAERGTLVHIVTTGYMMLDKDKKLLYELAQNGNIRLQEFKYYDPHYDLTRPLRYIDTKFRDMHIKLFITLSDDEKHNAVITGGRNIHDGFLFQKKPDYSKYPELIQYGIDDDFVHWNDFEMKITSTNVAKITAAHLLKFLNRDTKTQIMVPFSTVSSELREKDDQSKLRHFISLPYNDKQTLETLYVDLINKARTSIKISSPYLRPTDKIIHALLKAVERDVEVIIQTRVSLQGDTQAWLYEEVNKESINALFDKMKIYQWTEDSILHSKFLLIDDEIGLIGSINLSRRSFIQDVENAYVINDKSFIKEMGTIFNSYIKKSSLITEKEKRKLLPSILIEILKNQF